MLKNNESFFLIPYEDRGIVITRVFDSLREHVFDAFTRPELMQRWLIGPPGGSMSKCEVDFRIGGSFRLGWKNAKGVEIIMGGIYQEINRPEKIVYTEKLFDSWYPGETIQTINLTEKNGKTIFRCLILYETQQAREIVLNSSFEFGVISNFNRLDDFLKSNFNNVLMTDEEKLDEACEESFPASDPLGFRSKSSTDKLLHQL